MNPGAPTCYRTWRGPTSLPSEQTGATGPGPASGPPPTPLPEPRTEPPESGPDDVTRPVPPSECAEPAGRVFGHYRILAELGRGGMGVVYKALDLRLERLVALKVLRPELMDSPEERRRFLREAKRIASVRHPGINVVFDVGEEAGQVYIAFEYLAGRTVHALLPAGPLAVREALRIAGAMAEALRCVHEHGLLHRDVSAKNIMVGPGDRVTLLDFGLALAAGDTHYTRRGTRLGTPVYMAPEVVGGGRADEHSDIYSLGVVFYEMLTGTLPFAGQDSEALFFAIRHADPEDPSRRRPGLPRELDVLALTALAKRPPMRYQTAREFAAAIRKAGGEEIPAPISRVQIPEAPHVVVMPFRIERLDGPADAPAEAFAHGLAETVSVRIGRVPGVVVIAPSAVPKPLLGGADPEHLAGELGANLILRGTVQRTDDHLRITWTLCLPASGAQVAGGEANGPLRTIFQLESRVAARVARALRLAEVATHETGPLASSVGAAAHERYLQALGYLQRYENEASVNEAIAVLNDLAEGGKEAASVQAALGRAYLHKNKLSYHALWADRAAAACDRALHLDPELPEALITRGEVNIALGRPTDAVRDFERALRLGENSPDALLGLASAHESAGQFAEAETTYQRAIAVRPQYWGGYSRLGVLYFKVGHFAQAAAAFRRVITLSPDNSRGHYNLGAASFRLGHYDAALAAYEESLRIRPDASALTGLGTVLFYKEDFPGAVRMFEKAVDLRSQDPFVWGNLGEGCRWLPGAEARAKEALERAIELQRGRLHVNPQDAEGHASLARWLAMRGAAQEAVREVECALKLCPDDVNCMARAVIVYHLVGDRANALRWLDRALATGCAPVEFLREPELAGLREDTEFQGIVSGRTLEAPHRDGENPTSNP